MSKKINVSKDDLVTGAMVAGSAILAFEGMSLLRSKVDEDNGKEPLLWYIQELLKGRTPVNIGAGIVESGLRDNFDIRKSPVDMGAGFIEGLLRGRYT